MTDILATIFGAVRGAPAAAKPRTARPRSAAIVAQEPTAPTHGRQRGARAIPRRSIDSRMGDPDPRIHEPAQRDHQARAAQARYRIFQRPYALPIAGDPNPPPMSSAASAPSGPWTQRNGSVTFHESPIEWRARDAPVVAGAPREQVFPFPIDPGAAGVAESPGVAAVRATGISSTYFDAVVGHESGGVSDARNPQSSASGHFQFIEDTWLDMVRRHGARYGPRGAELAAQIDAEGRVRDPTMRARILQMRDDPRWAALMGGHLTQENAAVLRRALPDRTITDGDVYMLHFAGPGEVRGGIRLVRAAIGRERNHRASEFVSAAAVSANPRVFYDGGRYERRRNPNGRNTYQHYLGGGRARTAGEVYELQTARFRDASGNPRPYTGAVQPPRDGAKHRGAGAKQTFINSRTLAAQEQARLRALREGDGSEDGASAVDPVTGETVLPTAEELRRLEAERRADVRNAERRQRRRFTTDGERVTLRVPF